MNGECGTIGAGKKATPDRSSSEAFSPVGVDGLEPVGVVVPDMALPFCEEARIALRA